MFSFAAIGQQQDSVQNQNNQFRQSDQQQQNPAAVDTASTEFQQGDQDQQQPDDNLQQQPRNEFRQDADETRDSVNQNDMEGQDQLRNDQGNPDDSQQEMQQDNMNDQQTDTTLNDMNDQFRSSVEGSANAAPDVDVVEDKEGPDHQVVYKYQGEMYYVDRDKKELVKAEESELQDATQKVMVEEGDQQNTDMSDQGNEQRNHQDRDVQKERQE